MKHSAFCLIALAVAAPLGAQQLPFFYPEPAASSYAVSKDVRYGSADTTTLRMDVYRPTAAGRPRPALVFFNVATGAQRAHPFYQSWARIAASKGLVAIAPDLRQGAAPQDFRALLAHLMQRGGDYGIDTAAIAVYAGSGNVYTAFPVVEDPAEVRVKAAAMFYGGAQITQFRRDLPILYVRAGLDRPGVNSNDPTSIGGLVSAALLQNAPITVINDAGGHHAFEMIDDDAATRDVIDQTIDFVKRATAPAYQAAIRNSLTEVTAAGHVMAQNFGAAATSYAELVARNPDDARLRLSYGEALLGDKQFAKACAELAKLKGKGLGPRDLGLPAARACAQSGDADAAVAWLTSIPKRFLPAQVKDESAFAPLRTRTDFQALFQP